MEPGRDQLEEESGIRNSKGPILFREFNRKKIKRIEAILQANSSELAGVTECTNIDRKTRALIG